MMACDRLAHGMSVGLMTWGGLMRCNDKSLYCGGIGIGKPEPAAIGMVPPAAILKLRQTPRIIKIPEPAEWLPAPARIPKKIPRSILGKVTEGVICHRRKTIRLRWEVIHLRRIGCVRQICRRKDRRLSFRARQRYGGSALGFVLRNRS